MIVRFRGTLLLALLFASTPAIATEYLELTDFQLIDGTGAPAVAVQRMVVRDGVIVVIDDRGDAGSPEPDARWTRIGLRNAWVMPGLIDTHVHVARFPETRGRAERILRGALRGGITGVRDLGGDARALADIERAIGARELVAPTLVYSALFGGPDIFRNGPATEMASGRTPGTAAWAQSINRDTDLVRAIAMASGSGARIIKVYGDLDARLARGVIAESSRQGLATAAHATVFPARPSDLVEAGIGSLSHAPYLVWEAVKEVPADYRARIAGPWKSIPPDHPRLMALYRRMAERGVLLDATLYIYRAMNDYSPHVKADWAAEAFAWGSRATALAHRAGVRVTTGTDWFEPRDELDLPHTHAELALLVEAAGFTPLEAIAAGTRNGAAAMGLSATHGSLEIGKVADLLVLDADPSVDIHNSERIRTVVRQGRVVADN